MKQLDTLIIGGASITASPWFTWADIVCEILRPRRIINLSARGTGNYYIGLSCIDAVLQSDPGNSLCMPMFTCIDKFDMYLGPEKTKQYINEKHKPLSINGKPARPTEFSFWSTGSHWPLVKQHYQQHFFDVDIAGANHILLFHSLQALCQNRDVDIVPLFDMQIWNYLESQMNNYVSNGTDIDTQDFLEKPLISKVSSMLDSKWFEFESLIQHAMNNNLPIYNDINKLHPPSGVHLSWVNQWIKPVLEGKWKCHNVPDHYLNKIKEYSEQW